MPQRPVNNPLFVTQLLAGLGITLSPAGGTGLVTISRNGNVSQPAPAAKTVSGLMTAADLATGIITVLQGAGAASAQQLPTGANMDAANPTLGINQAFDFSVINISTTAAEAASVTTNTGWTLVGDMDIIANSASTTKSSGRFRAVKTAAATYTLYRIA